MSDGRLPPNQQLVACNKWPVVGETKPREDSQNWALSITGLIGRERTWSVEELLAAADVKQDVDIHCVTRWSKLNVRFRGIPLTRLLAECEPAPSAKYISFVARSDRQHSTSLPLESAIALQTLIAFFVNDCPIPIEHGGPIRAVVPGRYFYKSVKWLERLDLLGDDRLGFWEATAGYHNHADPWREQRFLGSTLTKQDAAKLVATRNFSGRDLRGIDASGMDLSGLQACDALLRDANLRRSNLQGADLSRANLSGAHLAGADLRGATMRHADLEGVDFSGADLRGVDFSGASLFGATVVNGDATFAGSGAILDATTQLSSEQIEMLVPAQAEYIRRVTSHQPPMTNAYISMLRTLSPPES